MPSFDTLRVARQQMRRILAERLDKRATIRWGKTLSTMQDAPGSQGITLGFDDGSSFEADYVIGTDGINSTVRSLLLEHEPELALPKGTGITFAMVRVKAGDVNLVKSVLDVTPLADIIFFDGSTAGLGGEFVFASLLIVLET